VVGRTDDLRKIRGVLFSPKTVEELVREKFPEIVEYEIVVERRGLMDVIMLRAEVETHLPIDSIEQTRVRLQEMLKIKTNLSFHVIIEPPGSLPRYTLKAKRFKDLREGPT
jgi:phenylacetate-CoA ligase